MPVRAPEGVRAYRSPNFGARRGGTIPDMVVLHYTAMDSTAAAARRLCDPAHEVSAHYLISEQGEVLPLVAENMRAWHAGAGCWGRVEDVNSHSIGIELANTGFHPFPEPQMQAFEDLLAGVLDRWNMPPERVIGHSDLAPGRKNDPGARFDWRRLAQKDLSVWPEENSSDRPGGGQDFDRFTEFARGFGYTAPVSVRAILRAFRLRFRPGVTGPMQPADLQMIENLCRRFPADGPGPGH